MGNTEPLFAFENRHTLVHVAMVDLTLDLWDRSIETILQ